MHEAKQWTVLGIVGARLFTKCQLGLPMFCERHYGIQFQWPYISFTHSFAYPMQTKSSTPYHSRPKHSTLNPILMGVIYVREIGASVITSVVKVYASQLVMIS